MNVVELFPCSGGMAEGLRRAGIPITSAFDYDADACASYAQNLGHAPVRMDVRDLLRMVEAGWRPTFGEGIDLLVADPPCTPWSRAGKRKGQADERDMMATTVELIRVRGSTRPTTACPSTGCGRSGTATARDRASSGRAARTRTPKECRNTTIPGVEALRPWVTCRQALSHLAAEDLGSPVRLRWRGQNGKQVASIPDAPARVVGTSNLSDGNVLAHPTEAVREGKRAHRHPGKKTRASTLDEPAHVLTTRSNGDGNAIALEGVDIYAGPNHRPSRADAPARTLTKNTHGDGALLANDKHPPADADAPSPTIGARDRGGQGGAVLLLHPRHPVSEHGAPARTLTSGDGGGAKGGRTMTWPCDRPSTTVQKDDRIPPPGHHDLSFRSRSLPNAVKLSEKAGAILQGFPEGWVFSGATKKARWAQIGMAMPPPLAEAVGHAIRKQVMTWLR